MPAGPKDDTLAERKVIEVEVLSLFDEREAAKMISCSVALLRKWRLFRQGPAFVKIGRLVRYRQEDLTAFLDSHVVVTGVAGDRRCPCGDRRSGSASRACWPKIALAFAISLPSG